MPRNPFTREDTMLGVCQEIGEDVGFNPLFLRVGFGVMLFWNIEAAVATYLALGLLVLAVRLLTPVQGVSKAVIGKNSNADNDAEHEKLPVAA